MPESDTVFDVATSEILMSDRAEGRSFPSWPEFSPDGRLAAVSFAHLPSCIVRIYETEGWSMVDEIDLGNACTQGRTFTGDGAYLVLADWLGNLDWVDTAGWSLLPPVEAHQGAAIWAVSANDSGTLVASTSEDGVRVWNVADQSLHAELFFNVDSIRSVSFLDDTHLLVVPRYSPTAVVVTLDPDDLAEVGNSRVIRAFTSAECATYDVDLCPTMLEALRGG